MYTGGDVCAASWGRCSRGPGYVRRGFPVFSLFSFRWMEPGGGGSACSFVSVIALRLFLVL